MKTYKLTLLDRIAIAGALPQKGNLRQMTIAKDIVAKVGLVQKDYKDYEIVPGPNGSLSWGEKGINAVFETKFSEIEAQEIKASLNKLNESNELTADHLGVCKLFNIS